MAGTLTVARTLTEALRRLPADDLAQLLTLRPDLGYPAPSDLAELSARATTTSSVGRSLDGLNSWQRVVAEGLAALPDPVPVVDLAELLHADPSACRTAVDALRARALLWGSDQELHLVRAVRDHLGPYPGGLAPPSARPLDAEVVEDLLADAGPDARVVVQRLLWNPVGTVHGAERQVTVDTARSPVERLLARRLLRSVGPDTVLLPREVAWRLRNQRFTPDPVSSTAPELTGRRRDAEFVDRAAVGGAYGLTHDVELVAHTLETSPHRLLREGGVAVRDLAGLARGLHADAAYTGFVLECAAATGLIAAGDGGRLLPTAEYDRWAERQPADRWRALVAGWRHTDRLFGRGCEPGAHALGPDAEAPGAATVRTLLVDVLAVVEVGTVVGLAEVRRVVGWHRPRLVRVGGVPLDAVLRWSWREVGWLGLTSLDAVSSLAAAAAEADAHSLPAALSDAFPATVEEIVLQADLTAVAPGPVPYRLVRDLRLLADQESRGGAAVFRFGPSSLRRAFDAGWSAAEVHRWLEHHSSTPVPQPLAYLVDDASRRHGSIRVGPASAYVRIADEAQAAAILTHPDATVLGLRELSPGVLVADAEPYEVVELLHRIGHSPAAEDSSGRSITSPDPLRAPRPAAHHPRPAVHAGEVAAAVLAGEEIRARRAAPGLDPLRSKAPTSETLPSRNPTSETLPSHNPTSQNPTSETLPSQNPTSENPASETPTRETLARLVSASASREPVRIRYVGADGQPAERDLQLLDTDAGLLRGTDARSAQRISIPLARVSSVATRATRHRDAPKGPNPLGDDPAPPEATLD